MVIETIFAEVYFERFENNSIKKYNLKAEYKNKELDKKDVLWYKSQIKGFLAKFSSLLYNGGILCQMYLKS